MDRQSSSSCFKDVPKLKISIVGDMAVGKTCLSLRFVSNTFRSNHRATISDIETKDVCINGKDVIFQMWDTAGQERFRSLLPLYMKGIDGALVVYDITEKLTYDNVTMWVSEVRKYSSDETVIMVVGNKIDLVQSGEKERSVPTEDARDLSEQKNILFMEASAKTGENVEQAFVQLGEEILKLRTGTEFINSYNRITATDLNSDEKKKCC